VVIIEISTYALIFAATAWALEVDGKEAFRNEAV